MDITIFDTGYVGLASGAGLSLCGDKYAALQGADAVLICTEWQQFCVPDFSETATQMCNKVIVDGRKLYQPQKLLAEGSIYFSVWRVVPLSATEHCMMASS
tara:strand:- start:197 stop:499 length:303 start_codon:yes stop_codon:yes gene_type:complete